MIAKCWNCHLLTVDEFSLNDVAGGSAPRSIIGALARLPDSSGEIPSANYLDNAGEGIPVLQENFVLRAADTRTQLLEVYPLAMRI